jgi:DNA-binding winged helix-turn-helix (wHTH) protein/TolB-like protein/Flp pilus assembly protein TadD
MSTPNSYPESAKRQPSYQIYKFGPFTLDTVRQLLIREQEPVPLTPKTYDTLLVLVESRGRLLSKEELMKVLWPDSFVEESNLTQQISMIRKALGESRGDNRYIVTVSGRGYRFAADVEQSAEVKAAPPNPSSSPNETEAAAIGQKLTAEFDLDAQQPGRTMSWFRGRTFLLGLALTTIVLILVGYSVYRQRSVKPVPQGPRSLAILPFRNLTADTDTDFLGYSLADAVVTKLSYVSEVTVRPSSAVEKYRNRDVDLQRVASELNVDAVLTGNFIRDGDDLRITCELVDINTKRMLWKSALDLKYKNLLTVQDDVAQHIVKGLELNLTPAEAGHLKADLPTDPLAYEYYLRGVDLYARSDFPLAIQMLEKSAELNPKYAPTWANLGKAYSASASFKFGGREQYRKAETAYQKALSIHPGHIETLIYMANMFTDTGRVEEAVPLLRETLRSNPSHAEAHWELGYAYRFAGALEESVRECERARQLDPGVKLNSSMLNSYLYLGQYDKFLNSLPNDQDLSLIVFYRGFGEYYLGDLNQSTSNFDRAFDLDPSLLQAQIGKALSFGAKQEPHAGLSILRAAEKRINERGVSEAEGIYKIAQAYAILGDSTSALRVLRQSIEGGFFPYPYLAKDPLLSRIRSEEQFATVMNAARQRHETFMKKYF